MISARILIVEDQGITARDLAARLLHLGYHVVGIAASGPDAIEKAEAACPDLVLMDIKLRGDMDGVQAAAQLRSRFGVPVTYLTAYADDETLLRAQSTAYGYLIKPFEERELHATIQVALHRRALEKQLEDAQQRLQASETRLRLMTDQLPAVLWSTDCDLRFITGVGAGLSALGIGRNGLAGGTLFEYFRTTDRTFPPIAAHLGALHGESREYESEWSGHIFESHVEPLRDPHGTIIGVIGLALDITARKRTEQALQESLQRLERALAELRAIQQQVVQQERLNALGTMASGIVHDFSNLLSPITGLSELLLLDPLLRANEERATHYLQTIHVAARDAARIVGRLRDFYRSRTDLEPRIPIEVTRLVEDVIAFTQPSWRDQARSRGIRIQLDLDLTPVAPIVGGDAEMREALTNLILNAVDALPEGGIIRVSTRMDGAAVVIEVSDTGIGMTPDVRERCFEPFYSTKGERGTGMGLAIVYGIVQRHDGSIEVDSEPGHGTTFRIRLPSQTAPAEVALESSDNPGRVLRVLLVDDEPVVRETVAAYLLHDGHMVETAVDGRDAWSKFCAGAYDLVITDSAMPEIPGSQLARAIKGLSPGTPIIGLTGFGEMMEKKGDPPGALDLVVSKPITLAALRRAISHVLAAAAQ